MANVRTAIATQQAAMDARTALIDVGGAGIIIIRDGAQPANANVAAAGTTLATLTFSATAFGAANTSGVATANAITGDASADATGTAQWARVVSGGGGTVFDCDVGEAADSATITLDNKNIVAGGTVDITSFTLTQPSGV